MKTPETTALPQTEPRNAVTAFGGGAIGALGGLICLGGAEFRLPLLIGAFRFAAPAVEACAADTRKQLATVHSSASGGDRRRTSVLKTIRFCQKCSFSHQRVEATPMFRNLLTCANGSRTMTEHIVAIFNTQDPPCQWRTG
jgi:hypothetical protein